MALFRAIATVILLTVLGPSAGAAPPPLRPETGIGLLLVRVPTDAPDVPPLILYREPGIGRITEMGVTALPHLARILGAPPGEYPLVVTARIGRWVQIISDDAGRRGWVEPRRAWPVVRWEEFLEGKDARLLRGLRKPYYVPRNGPGVAAPEMEPLTPDRGFRIVKVEGDRIQGSMAPNLLGWLRWRDEDGRLLIILE